MAERPHVSSSEAAAAAGPGAPGRPDADLGWLREAIELSARCPPSRSAFSVGAVLVSADGRVIATGYSRERDPADHAEEVALAKAGAADQATMVPGRAAGGADRAAGGADRAAGGADRAAGGADRAAGGADRAAGGASQAAGGPDLLTGATLYSSLEPCLRRASRPRPCAELIAAAGIRRVAVAWLEPPLFVPGGGAAWLRHAGVTVVEFPELAAAARAVNAHLLAG
jgi:diaminohydroxyphosphoribosylaminopyrimidine deaminase/5-amino-6-(5-phosphoribosylamino)uracil reductase